MFQVTKTYFNGYRCCCTQVWEGDDEWFDTLEEALEEVPRHIPPDNEGGLSEIIVTDGSTGEDMAEVQLTWPSGYYRGSGYDATLWSGWINPGEGQPQIQVKDFTGPGGTWEDCVAIIKEKGRAQKEREARRKLEEAQRELDSLKS